MAELQDRVALVTGGSRGIGRAIALALGEAGAADHAIAINGGSRFSRDGDTSTMRLT